MGLFPYGFDSRPGYQLTMKKRKWNDDQLEEAVRTSRSYAQVLIKLGLVPAGGNYRHIQKKIKESDLNTSHFKGQGWNAGGFIRNPKYEKLSDILVEDSIYTNSFHLKNRLIREEILERRCSCCKEDSWLGNPMPLELDHVNGIRSDNRLKNLRLLCPNCHAFTPTYRRKKQK